MDDFSATALDHVFDLRLASMIALTNANPDVVLEQQRRELLRVTDRGNGQRHRRMGGDIPGERTPYGGDIDRSAPDRLHDSRRRIGFPVVTVDGVSNDIVED